VTNRFTRRDFVANASALGASSLLGLPRLAAAEPPPETTKVRLFMGPVTCLAPQYVARELLYAEGFTEVQYVRFPDDTQHWPPDDLIAGDVDLTVSFIPTDIVKIDGGAPIVILAGSHIGCVSLVASTKVRSTPELKGKVVALASDERPFISMFAAYVGIDPQKDIKWEMHPWQQWGRLLEEGKIDAFMTGPPVSIDLREKKIGHVLVNTSTDKPWSQYFCCLVTGTRDFVHAHPVATKRALRAIMKATDVCASEPQRVARLIADKGLARYDNTLQLLREIPYGKWRELDPNDSLRFYALRMRELGIITATPQRIIDRGTDWRFLNELKKELKT